MESSSPEFFREQQNADRDPIFRAQLIQIAERFASQKKRVIFISRAWPYENDRLGVKEEWSVPFVDKLYDHLQLLGFHVILDRRDLGAGVQLDDAMKTSVDKADHALMLVTRTYIHKATKVPTSGVAREVHYITHKVEAMDPEGINGWVIAGKRRFVLPLAFNDTKEFPIADSHPGIATIFVQNAGYREALIDLATKVYSVEPALLREIIPSHANVLIQAVKKCYLEKKYIPRPFHDEPLPIEKGYVRLAIVKEAEQREKTLEALGEENEAEESASVFKDKRLTSFEQIYVAKEPIDIAEIFNPYKIGENDTKIPKRLLVLGRAGIGKSTLCQKMAHQWASLETEVKLWEEDDQEKFKLVVWVPLRNLLDYPNNAALSDVILNECISKNHTGEKSISKDAVLRGLTELEPDDILYVCDGYDEVAGRTTPLIDEILAKENVFVTTRPHGINQYLTSKNAKPFDRKFENIGFLDEDIENYIRALFGDEEENRNYAQALVKFLKTHPNIWGIAHIPINLMLICVSWKYIYKRFDVNEIQDITITNLYCGVLANLVLHYFEKKRIKVDLNLTPQQVLGHDECSSVLSVLSELAFQQMSLESLLISRKTLERTIRQCYPDKSSLCEDVLSFGVLTPNSSDMRDPKTKFYFVHLTFQEFFAAFYVAEKLRVNDAKMKQYVLKHKYVARYEMMWWFVAGLLKQKDANSTREALERFFDLVEAKPRDLGGIYHQMLLMRCMDECQIRVSVERKERYLLNVCKLIKALINRNHIFRNTFSQYFALSQSVLRQPEVASCFLECLQSESNTKINRVRVMLEEQSYVPGEIVHFFVNALRDSRWRNRECAVNFFASHPAISKEIQSQIVLLFDDPKKEVKKAVIKFFKSGVNVPEEIKNKIMHIVDSEHRLQLGGVGRFFSKLADNFDLILFGLVLGVLISAGSKTEVTRLWCDDDSPEKSKALWVRCLLKSLRYDPEILTRDSVEAFLKAHKDFWLPTCEELANILKTSDEKKMVQETLMAFVILSVLGEVIPLDIQSSVAVWLKDPEHVINHLAILFFSYQKEISPACIEIIGEIFCNSNFDSDTAISFLADISLSKILSCFTRMKEKTTIPKLVTLIAKLFELNVPLYKCDTLFIKAGEQGQIEFSDQKEIAEFERAFEHAWSEFMGLKFIQPDDNALTVRVISLVGLLPAPAPNSNNDALPESSENNKRCVIC